VMDRNVVGDMAPPDETLFEFLPFGGFRYRGDGKSVLFQGTASGAQLTDAQLIEFARIFQEYQDGIAGTGYCNTSPISHRILSKKDFRPYESRYFFKFVTHDTYEKYILQDQFLLSSLARFRRLEHNGDPAGDRFEGHSLCSFQVDDEHHIFKTVSGYDQFVFCGARDLRMAEQMKEAFGKVVLRISLYPFRNALARELGRVKSETKLVRYADHKIFRSRIKQRDLGKYPETLCPVLAVTLRDGGKLPTLFAKPERFALEREVRLAFEMPSDVSDTLSVILNNSSTYVERVFV
jgi:hypothetical protein